MLRAALHRARRIYWRLARPRTLGARCMVLRDGAVLLVKHGYERWWYMPGGAVERGETFAAAARRELREETALLADGLDVLGVYRNAREGKEDHVVVFVARGCAGEPRADGREVLEAGFFPLGDLPEETSPATRRRIEEYLGARARSEEW